MAKHDDAIDAALLAATTNEWTKTAVLISKVFDTPALKGIEGLGQAVAERIYVLVDNGRLEAQGNMRRWRDSEIRLIQK